MGNELRAREDARAEWVPPLLDQTVQDIRFAVRQLRRAPAFAVTATLLCALGVGATTAVFSVVNAVLFAPLPYPQADRIFVLGPRNGDGVDGRTFHAVRTRTTAFSALAAQRQTGGRSLVAGNYSESVGALRVSAEYFDTLGVSPRLGRAFTPQEDSAGGRDVVVISDALRQRAFAGTGEVLGRLVALGGSDYEVVGVMPPTFRSTPQVDVWVPLRLSPLDDSIDYLVLGRLEPTATEESASAELEVAKADLMALQPTDTHARARSLTWRPLASTLGLELALPLTLLLLAVASTTAVACANLTGLLLFRTVARQREVSTRLALGGSRGRVLRQFLTESLTLACLGGGVGLVIASWAMPTLSRIVPAALLVGRPVQLDARVLAMAFGMTTLVGMAFGLAPALAVRGIDARAVGGHGLDGRSSLRQRWLRRTLVSGEIAATTALLALAIVLAQSLASMYQAELGFTPEGVTVARSSMAGTLFDDPMTYHAFVDRALLALRARPGVVSAAVANAVPVERGLNLPVDASTGHLVAATRSVDWRYVSDGYFDALSMAVRHGRAFDSRDGLGAAAVAIVNEAFAQTYFGRIDVVSESVHFDDSVGDASRTIVGVVQDSRSAPGAGWTHGVNARGAEMPPIVYVPAAQVPSELLSISHEHFPVAWLVRSQPGMRNLSTAIADAVHSADPTVAVVNVEPLTRVVDHDVEGPRLVATLIAILSTLALAIAATGIFGLVAYSTALRRRETAIRLALGARRSALVGSFVSETSALAGIGIVLGMLVAWGLSRSARAVLGPLAGLDVAGAVLTGATLMAVVALAAAWPAIRASAADPLVTLRAE
ncbi:MAG: ADOP family duplicated permease [Vicinamibacterales bacterium]